MPEGGGFWAAFISWSVLGIALVVAGVVLQRREDKRSR